MTEDEWHRIEAAFHYARSLDGEDREVFVVSFTCDDPELGEQLKSLLAADERGEHRLFAGLARTARSVIERARRTRRRT